MIVWDSNSKQWVPSSFKHEPRLQSEQELGTTQNTHFMYDIPKPVFEPLQKIDSVSSEDMYNVYESYYKKMPQSRDTVRIPEEKEDDQNSEVAKQNSDLKEIKSIKHEHVKSSDYISMDNLDQILHDERYVEAVLYDLVNRNNPLPIVDKQGRRVKLTKLHKFPKNKLNKIDYEYEYDEDFQYNESDIRITSTAAPIGNKLSKYLNFICFRRGK